MNRVSRKLCALFVSLAIIVSLSPSSRSNAFAEDNPASQIETHIQEPINNNSIEGLLITLNNESPHDLSLSSNNLGDTISELENIGLGITGQQNLEDGLVVLTAEPPDGKSITEAMEAVNTISGIVAVQPNYTYSLIEDVEPSASFSDEPSELLLKGASQANDPYAQISDSSKSPNQYWLYSTGLIEAWNLSRANQDVTIAFLDSGAMIDHEDLSSNIVRNAAWDAYYNKALTETTAHHGDNGGHGTHVAGIAAAVSNNNTGIASASFNASILPIKVVDDTSKKSSNTRTLVAAYTKIFELVDSKTLPNIRVINISMGSYQDSVNDELLKRVIGKARYDYGIATVCAGGNGDNMKPYTAPSYPSDFEDCIAVTALEPNGANVPWSDYNEHKDISAPGRNIWSTTTTNHDDHIGPYGTMSGTSMSSPIVAGTLALMFSAVPDATVDEACEALYATALPIVDEINDRSTTSGSHGALKADAAIEYLQNHHEKHFDDVSGSDWFYETINEAVNMGIMYGYASSNLFGPNDIILRSQAAAILFNYYGDTSIYPMSKHTDVDQTEWYASAVNWAVATNAMSGYYNTTLFGTNDPLTREQLCCIIANVQNENVETADPSKFNQLPDHNLTNAWAKENVIWAVDKGILNGYLASDGSRILDPTGYATRAEAAAIILNAITNGVI